MGRCIHFPLQSPEFPVSSFKGTSVDFSVTRQLLLLRKNAFTPRLEGRDWPDSLGSPGSVQSVPPHPTPGSLATAGEADRGLLRGRAPRAGFTGGHTGLSRTQGTPLGTCVMLG